MSFPVQKRLKRLESVVQLISVTTTALSKFRNSILLMRTTIAATQTMNLPAATGKGGGYRIYIGVTATGNKVIKAAGTDIIQGTAGIGSAGTSGQFNTASNTNTITLNGSTTAGVVGTMVELWDVAPGVWAVQVSGAGTGVAATCFSNT